MGRVQKVSEDVESKVWQRVAPELEFDVMYGEREMTFTGVPKNQSVDINLGKSCMFSVIDSPAFVLSMEDVEIAVFERVRHIGRVRSFDITFVFKDYWRPIQQISNVEGGKMGAI